MIQKDRRSKKTPIKIFSSKVKLRKAFKSISIQGLNRMKEKLSRRVKVELGFSGNFCKEVLLMYIIP